MRLGFPLLVLVLVLGCSRQFEVESEISQAGGEVVLRGDFGGGRGVVVLVDGVAASDAVFESPTCVRVRVPALPRSGVVDVQLLFADGEPIEGGAERVEEIRLDGALRVSAPPIEIRD